MFGVFWLLIHFCSNLDKIIYLYNEENDIKIFRSHYKAKSNKTKHSPRDPLVKSRDFYLLQNLFFLVLSLANVGYDVWLVAFGFMIYVPKKRFIYWPHFQKLESYYVFAINVIFSVLCGQQNGFCNRLRFETKPKMKKNNCVWL